VGPRSVLDEVAKRKIPSPRRESKLRTPTVQPIAQRYTGENNIKIDLKEIVREGVDWMHLAQDRDQWRDSVNTVLSLRDQ
jgi:hypothetical protein